MYLEGFITRHATKVLASSVLVLSVLNAFAAYHLYLPHRPQEVKVHTFLDNDYPSELPIHPVNPDAILRFENGVYNITDDQAWESLLPSNKGIVHLGPSKRAFQLSMYRQLQCLDTIRVAYLALHASPSPTREPNYTEAELCIDWMRQAILCTGDTTLDTAWVLRLDDGRLTAASSGTDIDHRCRDWTHVREVVEKDQFDSVL